MVPSRLPALPSAGRGLDSFPGCTTGSTTSRLAGDARRLGRLLFDVRVPPDDIPSDGATLRRRLLRSATDCALGQKYTALAVSRGLAARGREVDFRATGQTGIMIAGSGIPIDAVVSDFVAGAAELLSPDAAPDHLDVIEGQGSLFHPAYAPVTLGLLHGSQPDLFVVCHDPGRTQIWAFPPPAASSMYRATYNGQRQPAIPAAA